MGSWFQRLSVGLLGSTNPEWMGRQDSMVEGMYSKGCSISSGQAADSRDGGA